MPDLPTSRRQDRWFAGRRCYDRSHRPRRYVVRLVGQPADGFADVGEVMAWLTDRGCLTPTDDGEGGVFYSGWGDPYCGVLGSRNDPWEVADQPALSTNDRTGDGS